MIINNKNKMSSLKSINLLKTRETRSVVKTLDISNCLYEIQNQNDLIQKLYMNVTFPESRKLRSQIVAKVGSYRKQDRDKQRYDQDKFITYDETVELIVASQMRCHYCRDEMYLFYQNVREQKQWTLDRVNNDIGHYANNVVISCLECNLKRRRTNKDNFLFTKQLKLVKKG